MLLLFMLLQQFAWKPKLKNVAQVSTKIVLKNCAIVGKHQNFLEGANSCQYYVLFEVTDVF